MHVSTARPELNRGVRWRTLPRGSVELMDGFWKDRQNINRQTSLAVGYERLERFGNFHDLRLAAGQTTGAFKGKLFNDSDVYKWLEAVACAIPTDGEEELHKMADRAIGWVQQAQENDGYLDSYFQTTSAEKWTDLAHGHELYCTGHLIEAAIAWRRFQGDDRLMDVARRLVDHIMTVFGPGKREGAPGHPEIELALVEMARETGEERYADLALFFLGQRGRRQLGADDRTGHVGPGALQDHVDTREATTVEGHAVRQLYLTCGVTDAYLVTGDRSWLDAALRQWRDMTSRKMFVTGGVGQCHLSETFSEPYELGNARAYCETCGAIASIMWNWRLLLATGEARFADVLERVLYNAFLSGISLKGDLFFYVNPLFTNGNDPCFGRKRVERLEWPWTPCCPPNVMRMMGLLDHYLATQGEGGLQIHQYVGARIMFDAASGAPASLVMETGMPWNGDVTVRVEQAGGGTWPLWLRIPEWSVSATCTRNGRQVDVDAGYLRLDGPWKEGDEVNLDLGMAADMLEAHPYVDAARGSLAVRRGPLIYCLEQVDQADGVSILDARIDADAEMNETWNEDILGGVVTLDIDGGVADSAVWDDGLYRSPRGAKSESQKDTRLRAIPYYAWANRGPNAMRVWVPRR